MEKWYPNLYRAIIHAIEEVVRRGKATDAVLAVMFKNNPKWGKRDRQFIKNKTFDIIRRLNLWQRIAMEIFGHDEIEDIVHAYILSQTEQLPAYLSRLQPEIAAARRLYTELLKNPPYKFGMPEWIYEAGHESWNEKWEEIAERLNKENLPVIRVNTLKITKDEFAGRLARKNYRFEPVENFPEAIILKKPYRLTATRWYRDGLFEWQDLSSQAVGYFSNVHPGMTVVDACAGAGGKTLHLAALMKNKGRLYAFDISRSKLKELIRRARRAGVMNLKEVSLVSAEKIAALHKTADVVLVDAPCSGSGTYRRKPHLKWKFSPDDFQKILRVQRHVLDEYARMVKPGGALIYVTCSVLNDENRKQIDDFLLRNKHFTFVEEKTILPGTGFDGFYMAKLKRS